MIEINLLPEEVKVKLKKHASSAAAKQVYKIVFLAAALIVLVHLALFATLAVKNIQLGALSKKWQALEPQLKTVQEFKGQSSGAFLGGSAIQQLTAKRINWAKKLNKLSLNLPRGVWFKEISLSAKGFRLTGAVVSLQKEEMSLINQFIGNLKNDSDFFGDFTTLELSSADSEEIGGYQVTNFIISGALK